MNKVYRIVALRTEGHYLVGMEPEAFLENFLPCQWNVSTPDVYKQKVPSKRRLAKLRSVPPKPGQVESVMYQPFVSKYTACLRLIALAISVLVGGF